MGDKIKCMFCERELKDVCKMVSDGKGHGICDECLLLSFKSMVHSGECRKRTQQHTVRSIEATAGRCRGCGNLLTVDVARCFHQYCKTCLHAGKCQMCEDMARARSDR